VFNRTIAYRDEEREIVFVRFRAPLHHHSAHIEPLLRIHVGGRGYRFGCLPTKTAPDTK
jgi:hypothetical protein